MHNDFKIKSLDFQEFSDLFHSDDHQLAKLGALRMVVDEHPGFPCRVSLQDAAIGEEVILLPYQHHRTTSPYQAGGPIFVRKNAETARLAINEVPQMLLHRLLSLRCYEKSGMMKDALVLEGRELKEALHKIFSDPDISYVHIHNAKPGCFNCVAERANPEA